MTGVKATPHLSEFLGLQTENRKLKQLGDNDIIKAVWRHGSNNGGVMVKVMSPPTNKFEAFKMKVMDFFSRTSNEKVIKKLENVLTAQFGREIATKALENFDKKADITFGRLNQLNERALGLRNDQFGGALGAGQKMRELGSFGSKFEGLSIYANNSKKLRDAVAGDNSIEIRNQYHTNVRQFENEFAHIKGTPLWKTFEAVDKFYQIYDDFGLAVKESADGTSKFNKAVRSELKSLPLGAGAINDTFNFNSMSAIGMQVPTRIQILSQTLAESVNKAMDVKSQISNLQKSGDTEGAQALQPDMAKRQQHLTGIVNEITAYFGRFIADCETISSICSSDRVQNSLETPQQIEVLRDLGSSFQDLKAVFEDPAGLVQNLFDIVNLARNPETLSTAHMAIHS